MARGDKGNMIKGKEEEIQINRWSENKRYQQRESYIEKNIDRYVY